MFFCSPYDTILAMTTKLVEGRKIADEILVELKTEIQELTSKGKTIKLAVVLVGENPASVSYINMKQKRGEEVGIAVEIQKFPENIAEADLLFEIEKLNYKSGLSGILVQLPLPKHIDSQKLLNAVDPKLDVDCLNSVNKQSLINSHKVLFYPPAPAAIMKILDYYKVDLKDSNVLLVGSGDLVGKPLAAMLLQRKINFNLANRHTEDLVNLAENADVIITGTGQAALIKGEFIKQGAVIIDAGTTGSDEGGITGDVDRESVVGKAALLAPVPGGVGPVTIAMLFCNVLKAARNN